MHLPFRFFKKRNSDCGSLLFSNVSGLTKESLVNFLFLFFFESKGPTARHSLQHTYIVQMKTKFMYIESLLTCLRFVPRFHPTDPLYQTSSARDYYRKATEARGLHLERFSDYGNLFSELPTHPASLYRW